MESIINEMYLHRTISTGIDNTEDYKKIFNEAEEILKTIKNLLPEDKKELVENFPMWMIRIAEERCSSGYIQGFKDGFHLAYETLNE